MPRDASDTRRKLLDAAALAFAEHGVHNASLLDITRQAGQRNRGALHYHFGSRDGVLCAVLEEHVEFLARREGELLEVARATPADEVEPVVEAVARPAAELGESGWRGRCFLLVMAELIEEDPGSLSPGVTSALARTGGDAVYAVLAERMPDLQREVLLERLALMTMFILRAVADRARVEQGAQAPAPLRAGGRARPQLPYEPFVQNLVAMAAAAVTAPDRVGPVPASGSTRGGRGRSAGGRAPRR
jgi:AcrR family transcriptional regulator